MSRQGEYATVLLLKSAPYECFLYNLDKTMKEFGPLLGYSIEYGTEKIGKPKRTTQLCCHVDADLARGLCLCPFDNPELS